MTRTSFDELYVLIESGAASIVTDVRADSSYILQPRRIPGAMLYDIPSNERAIEIDGPDREITIYCACPNETPAVVLARTLMGHSFKRVCSLHGGTDTWVQRDYSVEYVISVTSATLATTEADA